MTVVALGSLRSCGVTTAALALFVFFGIQFIAIRGAGIKAYGHLFQPFWPLFPINLIEEIARASSGIKALKLNGIACKPANIKSEKYPLTRFIWGAVALKHPSKAAEQFFDWVRTSSAAAKIISTAGAVPAFNKK